MNPAVGYRQLTVTDAQLQLAFPVHVLYPAQESPQLVPVGGYQLWVAPGAPVAAGRFPLVLVSHGTGSAGLLHRQLAQVLVKHGYVVALLEHPHNNRADDSWAHTPQNLVARPRHLQLALDCLLRDALLSSALVPGAAALLGHSLGGYAVLAAAGGRPVAVDTAERLAIPVPAADERVKALVLLAPALPWYAAPGSLAAVQVPLLVLAAEKDDYIPPQAIERVVRTVPPTTPLTFRVVQCRAFFLSHPVSAPAHQRGLPAVARPAGVRPRAVSGGIGAGSDQLPGPASCLNSRA